MSKMDILSLTTSLSQSIVSPKKYQGGCLPSIQDQVGKHIIQERKSNSERFFITNLLDITDETKEIEDNGMFMCNVCSFRYVQLGLCMRLAKEMFEDLGMRIRHENLGMFE